MSVLQKSLSLSVITNMITDYRNTFIVIITISIVFGYPALLYMINPIPPLQDLTYEHGLILNAQTYQPNFIIRAQDGAIKYYNIPYDLRLYYGRQRLFGDMSPKILDKLKGCQAMVGIHNVNLLLGKDDEWVWDIHCKERSYGYEIITQDYKRSKLFFIEIFQIAGMIFLLYVMYLIDRKKINDRTSNGE